MASIEPFFSESQDPITQNPFFRKCPLPDTFKKKKVYTELQCTENCSLCTSTPVSYILASTTCILLFIPLGSLVCYGLFKSG